MRLVRHTAAAFVVIAAVGTAAFPAAAQTEEDCKNAVWQAQEGLESSQLGEADNRAGHIETLLAQAGEAGLQGDYEKCLEIVRDAEGAAGLTNLLQENKEK
jgi:hypothetical protein